MANIDTRNQDALAGAVYFTVGRGTEGGHDSYKLSIAGVTHRTWGQTSAVAANSGYSIGTIQVDLGQRGTWPLGSTTHRALRPGETTYVDGIIAQASAYAHRNHLTFPEDTSSLRADLLSHGDGARRRDGSHRSAIHFIDPGVRDSINAWASSDDGKRWIHAHIDYPQIREATQTATNILDRSGSHISEDRRFEAVNIFAKTANQFPGTLGRLENVLRNGGDYDRLLGEAEEIRRSVSPVYDGPKAASIAQSYENRYAADPNLRAAMDRAHAAVARPDYDPSNERRNPDVQSALTALTGGASRHATHDGLAQDDHGREARRHTAASPHPVHSGAPHAQHASHETHSSSSHAHHDTASTHRGAMTDGALRRDAHGADVGHYQRILADLGYAGAHGRPLSVDRQFGPNTEIATRHFQRDHGIETLGVIGPHTRDALDRAGSRLMTHPDNANHPLFARMLDKVHAAEAERGIPHGEHSRHMAAALSVAALRDRVQPDRVELSRDGSQVRVVQFSAMGDHAELNRATQPIATGQAAHQSIRESSERAAQTVLASVSHDHTLAHQNSQPEPVAHSGRAR